MARVHEVRFTRDLSCFTTSGDDGFRIFNVQPLLQLAHITSEQIGGGKVLKSELLSRSNILALVTKDCDYAVKIWDCAKNKLRRDVTFDQEVTNIGFHHDKLMVALRSRVVVFVYSPNVEQIKSFDTRENPCGVMCLNTGTTSQIIAFPGLAKIGTVQVEDIPKQTSLGTISAHDHELACVSLNSDGTKIASASRHGTVIRVFSTETTRLLNEFRRGSNTALVYSLNFSPDSNFLVVASDKGTVHIFAIADHTLNRKSAFDKLSLVPTAYTKSQWGMSSFTVPAEMACVCAFIREKRSSVVAVCIDGTFHRRSFTINSSECKSEVFERYLELGDNMEM